MNRRFSVLSEEEGFTLIEMTLILAIAMMLTVIVVPFSFQKIEEVTEDEAIDRLIATIYSMQSYSMAYNAHTKVSFTELEGKTYYISEVPGVEVFQRTQLPDGMHVSSSNALFHISFQGNGNIVQSGVLTIVSNTKRIAITFQFQRGRMIIRESERVFLDGSDFDSRRIVRHF